MMHFAARRRNERKKGDILRGQLARIAQRAFACLVFAGAALLGEAQAIAQTYVVDVIVIDRADVDALTQAGLDVSGVRSGVAELYVTEAQLAWLQASGRSPRIREVQPSARQKAEGYRTYAALTSELQDLAVAHAGICRVSSLGKSVQGRELWAVLITDNPDVEEDEPEFKYVSTPHGDEPVGTELCLNFITMLLEGYGVDARVTGLVDSTAIWVVPLMNPDGREAGTRYNAQGFDLNRSFPDYPSELSGTMYSGAPLHDAGRPPETAHVMRWTAQRSFALSANFHAGALVVNYPYDDDSRGSVFSPTPDEALCVYLAERYSQHNAPMWHSAYFPRGITNGAAWYSIDGGMQDWNYRYAGCIEMTIELSDTKWPSASALPALWDDNRESMLQYLEAVHLGVRGIVRSDRDGAPVWARVDVDGNAQPAFTDRAVGDYHRLLLPGVYALTFSAPGHMPRRVENVIVSEGNATRLDVSLSARTADVDGDHKIDILDVQLVINAALRYAVPYDCDLDGSGHVDAIDVQLAINGALGL